jgi:hypothetical protein
LEASSARAKLEQTEGEIGVVRRERILPGEKTLAKKGLYEARLSRQLCHARCTNSTASRGTGRQGRAYGRAGWTHKAASMPKA